MRKTRCGPWHIPASSNFRTQILWVYQRDIKYIWVWPNKAVTVTCCARNVIGWEKYAALPGLEPRTFRWHSRQSINWATPHGRSPFDYHRINVPVSGFTCAWNQVCRYTKKPSLIYQTDAQKQIPAGILILGLCSQGNFEQKQFC